MIAVSYMVSIIYNFCIISKGKTVAFPHRSYSQEFGSETVKNGHVTRALHQGVVYLMEKKSHIALLVCLSYRVLLEWWDVHAAEIRPREEYRASGYVKGK